MNKYLLNFLLIFSIALLLSKYSSAQYTLDEVRVHENTDTRLLDVNNQNMVCGYYIHHSAGTEVGFVIASNGRLHNFFPPTGYTHTRVVSINDRDTPTVLIRASNSPALNAVADVFKSYYFPEGDSFSTWEQISLQVDNPYPTKVNNKNYMFGWYAQGASLSVPRYFWLHFDSLTVKPANHSNQYYATRYTKPPSSPQPTFGGGINDDGIACGYYYDTEFNSYTSFLFDVNSNSFTVFGNYPGRLLYDINNSGFLVGKLVLGANERAFMGTYNGTVLTTIPNPVFGGQPIQSEYTGVNDDEVIVGNYQHPSTNKWVGFIYRRNVAEYRLPGFDFTRHTWKLENSLDHSATPNNKSIWTNKYIGNPDYANYDVHSNQPISVTRGTHWNITPKWKLDQFQSYSWLGFCQEIDSLKYGEKANNNAADSQNYQVTHKPLMFERFTHHSGGGEIPYTATIGNDTFYFFEFGGYCYGFAYTALQKIYDSTTYKSWFNIAQNKDAHDYNNDDIEAIRTIERTQMKQSDYDVYSQYRIHRYKSISVWRGMFRLKNEYMKPIAEINPQAIAFDTDGWHEVMPYKIKTPLTLPFDNQYDTLFVYDSNEPDDSMQYLLVKNLSLYDNSHDSFYSPNPYYPSVKSINFNRPRVKDLPEIHGHKQNSKLKPTGLNEDAPLYTFTINGSKNYVIKNEANDSAWVSGGEFESDIEDLMPKIPYNKPALPYGFLYDTAKSVSLKSVVDNPGGYTKWAVLNNAYAMGIVRYTSNNLETDYGIIKNRYIAYGTDDNITKVMTLYFIQADFNDQYGVNYNVSNFVVKQDDSFITSSPEDYWYKIVRIGGDSTEYDIDLQILDNGNVRTLKTSIGINGNSTHVYDPYYNGPNGNQLVIYVDEGNTGTYNDTIFIDPTNKIKQLENVDYVSVYPNPVDDILNIEISKDQSAIYEISVFDLTGKNIMTDIINLKNGKTQLSLSNLSSGLYVVQLRKDGQMIYRDKILKQ